jgi:hypothetical protein
MGVGELKTNAPFATLVIPSRQKLSCHGGESVGFQVFQKRAHVASPEQPPHRAELRAASLT